MHAATSYVHSATLPGKRPQLGIVAKRCYRIMPQRRAEVGTAPPSRTPEPVTVSVGGSPHDVMLLADSDICGFIKPFTDVLLRGSAYALQGPAKRIDTGVRVGAAYKRVTAHGDRQICRNASGRLSSSAAEPFSQMPLTWNRAYGGKDQGDAGLPPELGVAVRRTATARESYSYPRNRFGVGFVVGEDDERLVGGSMPNLEDPDDRVTVERLLARDPLAWIDCPSSACYEPLDLLTFPRCMFHLVRPDWHRPSRPLRELSLGALHEQDLRDRGFAEPPDPRFFNCAPAGLSVCRLRGDERVSLWNLHRSLALLEFDLPSDPPRLLIEPPGCRASELPPVLSTVLIEPDEDRVTLTWVGSTDVAAIFPKAMCKEMKHAAVWSR